MSKGLIDSCRESACGWQCCSFGSDGHIVILPKELDDEPNIKHLKVIDDDYFGGKKVKCVAKNCKTCDSGYKPIMCRAYPLWVKSVSKNIVLKSGKCPLRKEHLHDHLVYVMDMFEQHDYYTPIDDFLSKAWVDKYEQMTVDKLQVTPSIHIRALSLLELPEVSEYEAQLNDEKACAQSTPQDVHKSLASGCSYGAFDLVDGEYKLIGYSLAYPTEYCTGYVDKCFVHEGYRGKGLHKLMLESNLDALVSNGVLNVYAMTAPSNTASISNFKKVGFKVCKDAKYAGHERYILKWELCE